MAQIVYSSTCSTTANGSNPLSGTTVDSGGNDLTINQVIPASSTNATTGIVFNGTTLQSLLLVASQNCTLNINHPSGSSPDVTISLKAGMPLRWSASEAYFSNPINFNVTQIYVTCTPATTLKGKVLTT